MLRSVRFRVSLTYSYRRLSRLIARMVIARIVSYSYRGIMVNKTGTISYLYQATRFRIDSTRFHDAPFLKTVTCNGDSVSRRLQKCARSYKACSLILGEISISPTNIVAYIPLHARWIRTHYRTQPPGFIAEFSICFSDVSLINPQCLDPPE